MRDAVIVSAARTPIGGMLGDFASLAAWELGAVAIKALKLDAQANDAERERVLAIAAPSQPYLQRMANLEDVFVRETGHRFWNED